MVAVWGSGYEGWSVLVMVIYTLLWLFFFFRFGWLSVMTGLFWWNLHLSFPLGLGVDSGYFHATVLVALVSLTLVLYGFKVSLAGRSALGDWFKEEAALVR